MGLRDEFQTDETLNPTGCRVSQWLDYFDLEDRDFIIELLESRRPTDQLKLWFEKKGLPPIGKDKLNDHRRARCTCPVDAAGQIA